MSMTMGEKVHCVREPSWNYQCCFEPILWEIAWSFLLEYFANDKQFAQLLLPYFPGSLMEGSAMKMQFSVASGVWESSPWDLGPWAVKNCFQVLVG